jgi:hypothetical protein
MLENESPPPASPAIPRKKGGPNAAPAAMREDSFTLGEPAACLEQHSPAAGNRRYGACDREETLEFRVKFREFRRAGSEISVARGQEINKAVRSAKTRIWQAEKVVVDQLNQYRY